MINREDAFWAWVWDGGDRPNKVAKRLIVEEESPTGRCIAIIEYAENAFLNGDFVDDFLTWNHHERIPEQKKRLMTREEILGFIAWNPHIVVKMNYNESMGLPCFPAQSISFSGEDIFIYEWASISETGEIGEWSKFEVEE